MLLELEHSRRDRAELPDSPRRLRLELISRADLMTAGNRIIEEHGCAIIHVPDPGEDADPDDDPETSGEVIGGITFFRIRMGDPLHIRTEAETSGYSDLETVVNTLYALSPRERKGISPYKADFRDRVTPDNGDLLVLYAMWIDNAWDGFAIETVAASQAIQRLADGCAAVVALVDEKERKLPGWHTEMLTTLGLKKYWGALYAADCGSEERGAAHAKLVGHMEYLASAGE